jgi:hypothetical protein
LTIMRLFTKIVNEDVRRISYKTNEQ